MKITRVWFGLGIVLLALIAPCGFGQGTTAVISGVVRDSSQAVIAGATVTATNTETGISRSVTSDAQGRYRLVELQPGTYQLGITATGFASQMRPGIVLLVGQEQALNFTMEVGSVEQAVTVTAAAPLVETSTASVASNVTQEQLRELPLNGRSFTDLVQLQPGAVAPTNQAATGAGAVSVGNGPQLSVSGARSDANAFTIDGTDVNPVSNGTPGSAGRVQLGVDTIREYQVITSNAKAEYGRSAGGIINAVTRSGTNDLHGSAFEFLRNSALDARDFFADENQPFRQNQFGVTFGGPLKRDKAFFFLGYEGLRQRLTATTQYNVPTPRARQGLEGIGLLTGTQAVDPRVVPYLNLYPLPNGADCPDPFGANCGSNGIASYYANDNQPVGENYGSARLDHNFSTNDFLFGRYTIDRSDKVQVNTLLSPFFLETHNQYVTIQEDHIFGPSLVNMFRAGYNRSFNDLFPFLVPDSGNKLSFGLGRPMGSLSPGSGVSSIGPNNITFNYQILNAFQFDDHMTWTHGAHTLKFGMGVERFQWNSDQPNNKYGSTSFNTFVNFLQAGPAGASGTTLQPGSVTYRHLRTWLPAFFVQDDYRLMPRLTLNLGLRWEFTTGFVENAGLLSYLARGPELSTLDDLKTGSGWINHKGQVQPRLGFNWGVDSAGMTALSGGFGVYHNQILHNNMIAERFQLPFVNRGSFSNANVRATFPDIYAAVAAFGSAGTFQNTETRHFDYYNFKSPTFYRYNLTVQRQLPGDMAVRVGYVGALGRHNARNQQLNRFPVPVKRADGSWFFPCGSVNLVQTPTAACPNPVRQFINPVFGTIPFQGSDSNTVYNALTVNLQKRYSRGLIFQASYTWQKSIDDISNSESNYEGEGRTGQFAWDRTMDRAQSVFSVSHVFVFNSIYELPVGSGKRWMNAGGIANAVFGGWQIGGILTLQKGTPFTISCGSCSTTGFQMTASRPNLKPGMEVTTKIPANIKGSGPASQYFDPTVFSQPAAGTLGNVGRSTVLGPGLKNVNFTLSKAFNFTERTRLQFRSEFFNLFNHPNFANPLKSIFSNNTGAYNSTAGRLNATSNSARQIQFGLKLMF